MSVSIKLIDGEDPKSLYQYDIGRQIQIVTNGGETIKEVQFSNVRLPEALIVLPKLDESGNIIADVPNIFTLEPRRISVYLITYLENGECVKYKDELNVVPRKKPSDYVYTETEVLNYSLLEKQINSLQSTKLTAPSSAQIGQIFRVQSITEDGNLVLEAVDMPSGGSGGAVDDVQINGTSIVGEDGVAEIPLAGYINANTIVHTGLISIPIGYGLGFQYNTKYLIINEPSESLISDRRTNWRANYYAVLVRNIDYAVKAAMCDGKGAEWTADEQAMARARMGIGDWEEVLNYTTTLEEQNSDICYIDFESANYKEIYVIIDETGTVGDTYMSVKFGILDGSKKHGLSYCSNTTGAFSKKLKYKTYRATAFDNMVHYQATSEVQLYGYISTPYVGRMYDDSGNVFSIGGICWFGTIYAGTNIIVWGKK